MQSDYRGPKVREPELGPTESSPNWVFKRAESYRLMRLRSILMSPIRDRTFHSSGSSWPMPFVGPFRCPEMGQHTKSIRRVRGPD